MPAKNEAMRRVNSLTFRVAFATLVDSVHLLAILAQDKILVFLLRGVLFHGTFRGLFTTRTIEMQPATLALYPRGPTVRTYKNLMPP